MDSLNCLTRRRCQTSIKTRQVFLWSLRVSFEPFRVNFSHFLVCLVTFFRQFRSVEYPPVLLLNACIERVCCIMLYIILLIAGLGELEETSYSQALQCISRGSWIRGQDVANPRITGTVTVPGRRTWLQNAACAQNNLELCFFSSIVGKLKNMLISMPIYSWAFIPWINFATCNLAGLGFLKQLQWGTRYSLVLDHPVANSYFR